MEGITLVSHENATLSSCTQPQLPTASWTTPLYSSGAPWLSNTLHFKYKPLPESLASAVPSWIAWTRQVDFALRTRTSRHWRWHVPAYCLLFIATIVIVMGSLQISDSVARQTDGRRPRPDPGSVMLAFGGVMVLLLAVVARFFSRIHVSTLAHLAGTEVAETVIPILQREHSALSLLIGHQQVFLEACRCPAIVYEDTDSAEPWVPPSLDTAQARPPAAWDHVLHVSIGAPYVHPLYVDRDGNNRYANVAVQQ